MYPEALYEAAFRYRSSRIVEKLNDYLPYAVRAGEDILYVNASGDVNVCLCTVYEGAENAQCLRMMTDIEETGGRSVFSHAEALAMQNCVQLVFDHGYSLSPKAAAAVRAYAKAHGISLRGGNRFPRFMSYSPFLLAEEAKPEETDRLLAALRAGAAFSGVVEEHGPEALFGLLCGRDFPERVPLMEEENGEYVFRGEYVPFPAPAKPVFRPVKLFNELTAHTVKRLRNRANVCCELLVYPEPMRNEPEERPYFTWVLFACIEGSGQMLRADMTGDYLSHPETVVNAFLEGLKTEGICPVRIFVRDERTEALLSEAGRSIGAAVVVRKDLPDLDAAEEDFADYLDSPEAELDGEAMTVAEMLLSLDDKEAKQVPRELLDSLRHLLELLPSEIAQALRKKYKL